MLVLLVLLSGAVTAGVVFPRRRPARISSICPVKYVTVVPFTSASQIMVEPARGMYAPSAHSGSHSMSRHRDGSG